jgi:signal transduction histidine kinase
MVAERDKRLLSEEAPQPGLTPEEQALVVRIGVFVAMRWIAIVGILVASLLARYAFNINFPMPPVYIICAFIALYNLGLFFQARRLTTEASGPTPQRLITSPRRFISILFQIPPASSPLVERARVIGNIHIALDLLALTALLHFTGGIENPFVFYFVFHVIIAGILLHYRVVYFLATSVILLVLLLVGLEYSRVIPHIHLEGFVSTELYNQGAYIAGVLTALATCLYGSAYMVTQISGELRKRQREVLTLQSEGLREKTRELEAAIKELAKLEEGRRHLLNFLAIASHDLKAPLAAVQSYLQLMLGGFTGELAEKQRHMVGRSNTRISELLELINDLLDISRIEGGQIVTEMEAVSLSEVAVGSLESVQPLAEEKKIKLRVDIAKDLPKIKGAQTRLQQVFTNLLSNAIKFTPEQGEIKLRVSRDGEIKAEVMDTGEGIEAEELPKIFDDFYRGDKERSGTGLGLSIVKRIVEAHGGKIWAESPNPDDKSGRGSRFVITLPKNLIIQTRKQSRQRATRKASPRAKQTGS